ncbi:MAG: DUF3822 family protein [Massilibacteroides sp.]|nr:DUF3822 family protein [Massilibacteroides sp.]MDD3062086.1 DUF3822 family protein [Massilibacteroides sp.]MDD4114090.1 DUF3822 family protein [Massilibacteroides sp.]MDD4659630.1 DUF3822 family protein [Massilibacteroides sp.]
MAIRIPDTLTINTSERYILSIRMNPDGFSFSVSIPSKSNSFFYQEIEFDHSKTYIESLKEAFFSEEFLSWNYKKIYIFCFTPTYVCIPENLFDTDKRGKIIEYAFLSTPSKSLVNVLIPDKEKLIFEIVPEIYEFLCRSFIHPEFLHHMTLPLRYWEKQNLLALNKQMHVLIHKRTIDIACYKQEKRLFLNSFQYQHVDDILYYIAYSWKQSGLDQFKDRLFLFGEMKDKQTLMSRLRHYIHFVSDMELPADAYLRNAELKQASFEIILSVCE